MDKLLLVSALLLPISFSFGGNSVAAAADRAGHAADQAGTQAPAPTRTAGAVITIIGCVQRETAYRAQIKDGRGGAAGSGVGADNEVVLHSIRTVSNETFQPTAKPGIGPDEVYSVTGDLEREMARAVGQQVAVSGYVEVATTDGTAQVKDLPRFNAAGWHMVAPQCPAGTTKR